MDRDGRMDTPRFGKTVDYNSDVSKRGSSATSTTSRSSDSGDLNLDLFRLNGDSRFHLPRARDLSDVVNKDTISKDRTSGAESRRADLFEYIGRRICKIPRKEEWSEAVGSSSSPKWEQDLPQDAPHNAQQLMEAQFIQQQQAGMGIPDGAQIHPEQTFPQSMQQMQQLQLQQQQMQMQQQQQGHPQQMQQSHRMGAAEQQAQLQQRIAIQTQQQISILSTKLYQENLPNWLSQQRLAQETCPPDLLQKFKLQCLSSARQKVLQLRQQQQQQQALVMQQKQHVRGQMSPRRLPSM